jgi:hypothetical protein
VQGVLHLRLELAAFAIGKRGYLGPQTAAFGSSRKLACFLLLMPVLVILLGVWLLQRTLMPLRPVQAS